MLQSKFHRPWQPRVSDSQPYNPFAHNSESEVSFSAAIEQAEGEVHKSAAGEGAAAASANHSVESVQSVESVPPVAPEGPKGRYARLAKNFAKH